MTGPGETLRYSPRALGVGHVSQPWTRHGTPARERSEQCVVEREQARRPVTLQQRWNYTVAKRRKNYIFLNLKVIINYDISRM